MTVYYLEVLLLGFFLVESLTVLVLLILDLLKGVSLPVHESLTPNVKTDMSLGAKKNIENSTEGLTIYI